MAPASRTAPRRRRLSAAIEDVFDRCADDGPPYHFQVRVVDETLEAAASEEPDMTSIQQSALVIVEAPGGHPDPRVPMGEVRDADEDRAARGEPLGDVGEQMLGRDRVLEDVGGDDAVEAGASLRRQPLVEVRLDERIEALADAFVLDHVDTRDVRTAASSDGSELAV